MLTFDDPEIIHQNSQNETIDEVHDILVDYYNNQIEVVKFTIAEEVYASDDTFASYIGIALVFLVVYSMAFFAKKYIPG